MSLLFDNSSAKYDLKKKKFNFDIQSFVYSYCLTFDIVSFEFTIISFRVSLRNLIIIFNDWLSVSSDVVCCGLLISTWIVSLDERFDSVVIGICSELNSSISLDLNNKLKKTNLIYLSYSLSDSCSVCISLPDDGDTACSLGGVTRDGGLGVDLSDSSSRNLINSYFNMNIYI